MEFASLDKIIKKRLKKNLSLKKGDIVAVCYDGKQSRATPGKILQIRGFAIQVAFYSYAEDRFIIRNWFIRHKDNHINGYVRFNFSVMKALFGTPGDYYSVLHIKNLEIPKSMKEFWKAWNSRLKNIKILSAK